ncbi:hypothetical protein KGF57_001376 [Candida theae]|uniref:UBA domain-containing protein n=1 Tax=Candida theae TaxID=1198502 RepID=A0AAD5BH65_9ASCO|nr:uncharacterized protein KGF57_001376 [Candida theae]KAI5962807.1 hypothetical protein KGF57_001376 [Candida theae]
MDSQIKQLVEMGFTRDQAESALQKANNDLEQAIGYLFGDSEEKHPTETQMFDEDYNSHSGTVAISNPHEIPSFPLSESQEYAYSSGWGSESEQLEVAESQLFKNPEAFLRTKDTIPAVVAKWTNSPGRFVVPLYVLLCQIPSFNKLLLSKDVDQPFDENWFTPEQEEEATGLDPSRSESFIAAIQRLIGFFSAHSERSFISSEWFYNRVSESFKAHEFEDWDDLVYTASSDLEKHVKSVLDQDFDLLSSHATSHERELKLFKTVMIDSECRESTLVESLSKLLRSPDAYAIKDLAPVLAIQISPSETGSQVPSINVEESFYPALFTAKYKPLIEKMDRKRLSSSQKRATITSRIMALSSFEGKKIRSFLDKTKEYVEKVGETEACEDLQKLSDSIKNESSQLNEALKAINIDYAKLDTSNQENIIEELRNDDEWDIPPKYHLVGAVLSHTQYAYRPMASTGDDDWVLYLADTSNGIVTDFRATQCSFNEVRGFLRDEPNDKYIFLVYADENTLQRSELELPPSLSSFFARDNAFLHSQIEEKESKNEHVVDASDSSSEEVSDEDANGKDKLDSDTDLIDL